MFTGQHSSVGVWLGEKVVVGAEEVDGSVLGLGVSSRQWKKPVPLCEV